MATETNRPLSIEELRQYAAEHGLADLDNTQLLTLLLNRNTPDEDAFDLASRLLLHFDDIETLVKASYESLLEIPGIGPAQALKLQAAFLLGRRLARQNKSLRPLIRRPSDVIPLLEDEMTNLAQEQLRVLLLDAVNQLIDISTVYIGSLNMTLVRVAEIFRPAITRNCPGIILVHNHPSGDATPSVEDIQLTHELVKAGKLLDIAVLDHLIIGQGEWVSMRERNLGF
jgi:DNA repair protein RadC